MGGRGTTSGMTTKKTALEIMQERAAKSAQQRKYAIEHGLTDYVDTVTGEHWYNNGGHWDTKPVEMNSVLGFKKGKNKKETFVNDIEYHAGVRLENDKNTSLNGKRNLLYTKIPQEQKNSLLSYFRKRGIPYNEHNKGYYWLDLSKYNG